MLLSSNLNIALRTKRFRNRWKLCFTDTEQVPLGWENYNNIVAVIRIRVIEPKNIQVKDHYQERKHILSFQGVTPFSKYKKRTFHRVIQTIYDIYLHYLHYFSVISLLMEWWVENWLWFCSFIIVQWLRHWSGKFFSNQTMLVFLGSTWPL